MSGIQSIVRDKAGNAIASSEVSVFDEGTATLSSIFSDPQLTEVQANPFSADSNGFYSFYAAAGLYDLEFKKGGFPTVKLFEVELPLGVGGGTINGNVTINGNLVVNGSITGEINHSTLLNLDSDDHLQYLNRDGSRPMTGDLDIGENDVIGVTRVTGPDTGGAARPGISMSEGIAPELRLDFNEANLAATPQVILNTDGINLDATVRAQGAGDLQFGDNLDMNGFAINELLDPILAQDAATKAYVDAQVVDGPATFLAIPDSLDAAAPDNGKQLLLTALSVNNGSHSLNAGNVVIGTAGLYLLTAQVKWLFNVTGDRGGTINEGINELGAALGPASGNGVNDTTMSIVSKPIQLAANDEISYFIYQDSGGVLQKDNFQTWLAGHRIG